MLKFWCSVAPRCGGVTGAPCRAPRRQRSSASLTAFLAGFAVIILNFLAAPAQAHVFSSSEGIVYFHPDGQGISVRLIMNLEAILAGVDPEVKDTNDSPKAAEYNRLRELPPDQLKAAFEKFEPTLLAGLRFETDGKPLSLKIGKIEFADVGDLSKARNTDMVLEGTMPPDAKVFRIGWAPEFGKLAMRTVAANARNLHIEILEKGEWSDPLVINDLKSRSTLDMLIDFMKIGYTHIVPKGTDHILFVVGIFLLSTKWRPILAQVTSFTVAHTVTLGLGTAGIISIPSTIVEPLIAASIVYVAVENILRPTLSPWRPAVVFMFGLLHGLGFAGVLRDFQIPDDSFLLGLLSFNVGVELGQLSIIAVCFLLVGIWFGNKPWYRQRIVIPGSLIIAAIGAFWFVQRVILAVA